MLDMVTLAADNYNKLLDVSAADMALNAKGRQEAIEAVLSVVRKYSLEKDLGVRLLHKHNDIDCKEFMFEYFTMDDAGAMLITKATDYGEHKHSMVPNSWKFTENGFLPVEFSEARVLETAIVNPDSCREAFSEIAAMLTDLDIADIIGPSLRYGPLIEMHRPNPDAILLERTSFEGRANLVRFEAYNKDSGSDTISTKWFVKPNTDYNSIMGWYAAMECACSVSENGGHLGTHIYFPSPAEPDKEEVAA